MTDQDNSAPAVWDPTARGGAGGWVRRKSADVPPAPPAPGAVPPPGSPQATPPAFPPASSPMAPPPPPGAVGDEGPMLGARPYLAAPGQPTGPAAPPGPGAAADQQTALIQPVAQPPVAQPPLMAPPPMGQPPIGQPPIGQPPAGFPGQAPYPPFGQPANQPFPQQPFPPQPAYQGYEDYDEDEQPRSRAPLFLGIGLVLVLALCGGAVWALTGGASKGGNQATAGAVNPAPQSAAAQTPSTSAPTATSPSPSTSSTGGPNAPAQAKSLSDLLGQAESTRTQIGSAVAKVRSCPAKPEVDKAAEIFDAGAKQRDQLIDALGKLNLSDVAGGSDLAQVLRTAWQQSGDIDRAYAAWARTVSSQGCQNGAAPNTADLKKADELNPQATRSKSDFIIKWKPVADSFNLPQSSADRI